MDGNRRVGDPLDAAAAKRFPDLFVATIIFEVATTPSHAGSHQRETVETEPYFIAQWPVTVVAE